MITLENNLALFYKDLAILLLHTADLLTCVIGAILFVEVVHTRRPGTDKNVCEQEKRK